MLLFDKPYSIKHQHEFVDCFINKCLIKNEHEHCKLRGNCTAFRKILKEN